VLLRVALRMVMVCVCICYSVMATRLRAGYCVSMYGVVCVLSEGYECGVVCFVGLR
jgi:hypothetical protein